jgi:hypothetical protein
MLPYFFGKKIALSTNTARKKEIYPFANPFAFVKV